MACMLLLFLVPLVLLGGASSSTRQQHPQPRADWPCPEKDQIAPCICTEDTGDLVIDMDCSEVQNEDELAAAFQAYFPFDNFRNLIIVKEDTETPVPITNLTRAAFNNASFANIQIKHTGLVSIDKDAFIMSYPILETMDISDNPLVSFPFDMLADCPVLTSLKLDKNTIHHMSDLRAPQMTLLEITHNPRITFYSQVFYDSPNLERIVLSNTDMFFLPDYTFSQQDQLNYLDLSFNSLQTLYNGSLHFVGPLEQIKLNNNKIRHIHTGAFSGLPPGTVLLMQNNELTDLPQQVWEPIFKQVAGTDTELISLQDNPIRCECNLLWLMKQPIYLDLLTRNSACEDGTFFGDVASIIISNC